MPLYGFVNNEYQDRNSCLGQSIQLSSGAGYLIISNSKVTYNSQINTNSYVVSHYLPTDKDFVKSYTPTYDYHPATKKYVDDAIANNSGGGSNAVWTEIINQTITPSDLSGMPYSVMFPEALNLSNIEAFLFKITLWGSSYSDTIMGTIEPTGSPDFNALISNVITLLVPINATTAGAGAANIYPITFQLSESSSTNGYEITGATIADSGDYSSTGSNDLSISIYVKTKN